MLLKSCKQKMLHSTADSPEGKEELDHNNISPETGIFITHSPTKAYAKNNLINMFRRNNVISTSLAMLLALLLCCQQQCLASADESTAAAIKSNSNYFNMSPPAAHECNSMDLRHNCRDFNKLRNCTVVTGFLSLAHYFGPTVECNETYNFLNLREITDFLIISELRNFTSIRTMFPNLTVIRGRRLLRNYALIFSSDYVLEKVSCRKGSLIVKPIRKMLI